MAYKISGCIGCANCEHVCPVNAIYLIAGRFEIDPEKCIECGECETACPVAAPAKV